MPSVYNPHLILLDIDGTLIRSNGTIPSANIKTINKLKEMGNIVCLATGRADETAEYKAIIYLKLTTPSISNSWCTNTTMKFSDPDIWVRPWRLAENNYNMIKWKLILTFNQCLYGP